MSTPNTVPRRLAYSIDEVASAVGISRDLVYELIASGRLKTVPVGARRRVIPTHELERLLSTDTAKGAA